MADQRHELLTPEETLKHIGKSVTKHILQPKRSLAFVTFNNQSSVLLSMMVEKDERNDVLCLLHETRIFAFNKPKDDNDDNSADSALSDEQNLLLNLLTTPKYRVLSSLYFIFRLLDNLTFLSIIFLSIYYGKLTMPSKEEIALLSVLGFELFYDVVLFTNKYWILQRMSPYICLLMYAAYLTIIFVKYDVEIENTVFNFKFAIGILGFRFGAFVLEDWTDIFIDAEIHNDLIILMKIKKARKLKNDTLNVTEKEIELNQDETNVNDSSRQIVFQIPEKASGYDVKSENKTNMGQTNADETIVLIRDESTHNLNEQHKSQEDVTILGRKLNKSNCCQHTCQKTFNKIKDYFGISEVNVPENVNYEGSIFAWFPYSVFTKNIWNKKPFNTCIRILLFPFILIFPIPAFPLIILTFLILCVAGLTVMMVIFLIIIICAFGCRKFGRFCCAIVKCSHQEYQPMAVIKSQWQEIKTLKFFKEILHV